VGEWAGREKKKTSIVSELAAAISGKTNQFNIY
jgi:hypothetical protein